MKFWSLESKSFLLLLSSKLSLKRIWNRLVLFMVNCFGHLGGHGCRESSRLCTGQHLSTEDAPKHLLCSLLPQGCAARSERSSLHTQLIHPAAKAMVSKRHHMPNGDWCREGGLLWAHKQQHQTSICQLSASKPDLRAPPELPCLMCQPWCTSQSPCYIFWRNRSQQAWPLLCCQVRYSHFLCRDGERSCCGHGTSP